MRTLTRLACLTCAAWIALAAAPAQAGPCDWNFPVGDAPDSPAPLGDHHPVNGNNLPQYGAHLGADFWSGGGCTDYGRPVYAVADGHIVEIVDNLGSYLDVVVIRHSVDGIGNVYSMYGHIARDGGLSEGQNISARTQIGQIDDVLAYFSPCHLHFELLNESAFQNGPFCNGCANAGFHVSPGYDRNQGVVLGSEANTGDDYIEVVDNIADNRWYFVDEFLAARIGGQCSSCGDGMCDGDEDAQSCPQDCGGGTDTGSGDGDGDGDGDTGTTWGTGDGDGDGDTSTSWGDGDGDPGDGDGDPGDGDGDDTSGGSGTDTGTGGAGLPPGWGTDGDPANGCACTSTSTQRPGPGSALLTFGLLLIGRRRRATRP